MVEWPCGGDEDGEEPVLLAGEVVGCASGIGVVVAGGVFTVRGGWW